MPSTITRPLMLIFPFGYLSHYLRCLQLAKVFSNNYEVLFAEHKLYSSYVTEAGFGSFTCVSIDAQKILPLVQRFDFKWLNETTLEAVFTDQVKVINELQPAVVMGDATPTLRMAADATHVPMIALMNGYMSKYYGGVRNLSRTHPLYKFLHYLPEDILNKATTKGEAIAFAQVHKPFTAIRKKYQLQARPDYLDESAGDLNLICDSPGLFPQVNLPENYTIVGPLFYDSADTEEEPIKLNTDPAKKTIFVSMGSTGDWGKLRFLTNPYFRKYNIITAGDKDNVLAAEGIIQLPFAHAKDLFPTVDLVICHGGNGSVYQALRYGIPVLCKTNHFEQEWNVAAFSKAGVVGPLDGVTSLPGQIAQIEEWINKKGAPVYTNCSNTIQQDLLKQDRILQDVTAQMGLFL